MLLWIRFFTKAKLRASRKFDCIEGAGIARQCVGLVVLLDAALWVRSSGENFSGRGF